MRLLPDEPYRRAAYLVFYSLLGILAVYVVAAYLFPLLLPFLIAFGAAALLRRPSAALARKLKLPQKAVSVALVIIVLIAGLGLVTVVAVEVAEQLGELAKSLLGGESAFLAGMNTTMEKIGDFLARLPFFGIGDDDALRENIGSATTEMVRSAVVSVAARLPGIAARLIAAVPRALIFSIVTILSAIYFCADYEHILRWIKAHLRGRPLDALREMYGQTGRTLVRYGKAYAVLFLFTFAELLAGFVVLKIRYAFLLALFVAVIDILPVLGTGTVLIPWAVVLFIMGEARTAVGLLILYAVIALLRQILEPRIVGAGIGMPPLLALIAMYVGLRLFGFFGMLLLPIVAVVLKNTIQAFRDGAKKERS